MKKLLVMLLVFVLSGCGYINLMSQPPLEEWTSEVAGLTVFYRIVASTDSRYTGAAALIGNNCTIVMTSDVFYAEEDWPKVRLASHELAHCLDLAYLNGRSNYFGNAGCVFGEYYCNPREGFAEAYSYAYIDKCLFDTSPLGLKPGDGRKCELPDWRKITPDSLF